MLMSTVQTANPKSWPDTYQTGARNGDRTIHAGPVALFSRQIGPSMNDPTTLILVRLLANGKAI
jgi:hypothetical protein